MHLKSQLRDIKILMEIKLLNKKEPKTYKMNRIQKKIKWNFDRIIEI